jgi:hypothetical protein
MKLGFLVGAALLAVLDSLGGETPGAVVRLSVSLPGYFSQMQNYVAQENIHQEIMEPRNGTLARKRDLTTDFQIDHLVEEPSALWEFRFVRAIDGKQRPEVDAEIATFASLRHASARAERQHIVDLAMSESLPGCYWHNLNLVLLALRQEFLGYFDWTDRGDHFEFRQVRGPGIPEDFFNSKSLRHYPSGQLWLTPDGLGVSRLDLQFDSVDHLVRVSMGFAPPSAGMPVLPKHHEVRSYRRTRTGGALEARTTYDYSSYRRFEVTVDTPTR